MFTMTIAMSKTTIIIGYIPIGLSILILVQEKGMIHNKKLYIHRRNILQKANRACVCPLQKKKKKKEGTITHKSSDPSIVPCSAHRATSSW